MERVSDQPARWSQATIYPDMWVDPNDDPRNSEGVSPDGELATLRDYVTHYRMTLRMKCEGLDAEQLARRSVSAVDDVAPRPPSATLPRRNATGATGSTKVISCRSCTVLVTAGTPDGALAEESEVDAGALELWRASRQPLTPAGRAPGSERASEQGRHRAVRGAWAAQQDGLEEYARHCGHADLLRECIDGRVGQCDTSTDSAASFAADRLLLSARTHDQQCKTNSVRARKNGTTTDGASVNYRSIRDRRLRADRRFVAPVVDSPTARCGSLRHDARDRARLLCWMGLRSGLYWPGCGQPFHEAGPRRSRRRGVLVVIVVRVPLIRLWRLSGPRVQYGFLALVSGLVPSPSGCGLRSGLACISGAIGAISHDPEGRPGELVTTAVPPPGPPPHLLGILVAGVTGTAVALNWLWADRCVIWSASTVYSASPRSAKHADRAIPQEAYPAPYKRSTKTCSYQPVFCRSSRLLHRRSTALWNCPR